MNSSKVQPTVYFFHTVNAPGSFLVTRTFSQLFSILGAFILSSFAVIIFTAIRRAGNRDSAVKRSTLQLLFCQLIFTILECLWSTSMTVLDKFDPTTCKYYGRLGGCLFVTSNFFVYLLLLKRSESTKEARGGLFYRVVLVAVKVGTATVPLVALYSLYAFQGKVYFTEEFCVQYCDAPTAWVILCLDTSLSSGYLLLFLLPVLNQLHMMSTAHVHPYNESSRASDVLTSRSVKVRVTARRNLKISSVAIGSTFLMVTGVCLASQFTTGEDMALLPYLHWLNWDMYGGITDLSINCMCTMIMVKGLWATGPSSKGGASRIKGKANKSSHPLTHEPLFPQSER